MDKEKANQKYITAKLHTIQWAKMAPIMFDLLFRFYYIYTK